MFEVPEKEAHSPELLRKEMLMWESDSISSVLPDSVLVWNRRSMPPFSYAVIQLASIPMLSTFCVSERMGKLYFSG
jgi:hypothetical protein